MRRHVVLAVAALLSASCFTAARAADVYWDTNGSTAGAGGATPNGFWDGSTPNWSTSSAGTVATQIWNAAGTDVAVFSAGSDATGAYAATIDSQTASGLRLEDGDVSISSGILTLKTGSNIDVASGHTMTIDGTLANNTGDTITKISAGTLSLLGTNGTAGIFNLNTGTVGIGNTSSFGGTTNAVGTSTLNINGGSLSNTNPNTTAPIVNLVNSLTVNINADFSVENSPQGNHLLSFQTSAAGAGKVVLTGAPNSARTITVNQAPNAGSLGTELAGLAFNNLQDGGNNIGIIKKGTGTLRFEAASTITSQFTGDVTVQAGSLEVSGTGWIGGKPATNPPTAGQLGGNIINLAGGNFNVAATRNAANPINNPFVISADAKFTQTINASTLYGTLSETYFGGLSTSNNSKITFENMNPAVPAGTNSNPNDSCPVGGGPCQIFYSRFGGTKSFSYGGNVEIKNGTVANQLTRLSMFNTTGSTTTWSGVISGNGTFTRSATSGGTGGATVLTGANTLTGIVSVTDGTLYVNNTSGSGTGSGPVEVGSFDNQSFWNSGSTGTLAGNGSTTGAIRVWRSGFLKPGTSASAIATLSGGSLTFSDANDGHTLNEPGLTLPATYGWDLNSTSGTADLMNVNGNLTFGVSDATFGINPGGAFAALVTNDLAPTAVASGTKFTLFSYSGTWDGNTFNGLADDTGVVTIGPNQFHINYNDMTPGLNGGSLGKYVTLTAFGGILAGDYNGNGVVDAADYVLWRKTPGSFGGAGGYTTWRSNFGNVGGAGSGSLVGGAVPEPTSAMLVLVGLVPLLWRRSR